MTNESIGLLVMAYGGPNDLSEVEPYLMDVRGGRPTPAHVIKEVRERYRRIGGRSPILERTQAQARALEDALNKEDGTPFRAFTGMRHWHPYIKATLDDMARAGIRHVVGLVMAPHYSRMSVGAYYQQVDEAAAPVEIARIERWHMLPGYLDALATRVRAALVRFPESVRTTVPVIFTAHSLPQRILEWGDPYPVELLATVDSVMERLGPQPHEFAYQSAAKTPDRWLGPDAGEVITQPACEGHRHALIAPIGFVSEHVEILYDIDIEFKRQAHEYGIQLERIEMLNTAQPMIDGLAELVRQAAAAKGWL